MTVRRDYKTVDSSGCVLGLDETERPSNLVQDHFRINYLGPLLERSLGYTMVPTKTRVEGPHTLLVG